MVSSSFDFFHLPPVLIVTYLRGTSGEATCDSYRKGFSTAAAMSSMFNAVVPKHAGAVFEISVLLSHNQINLWLVFLESCFWSCCLEKMLDYQLPWGDLQKLWKSVHVFFWNHSSGSDSSVLQLDPTFNLSVASDTAQMPKSKGVCASCIRWRRRTAVALAEK